MDWDEFIKDTATQKVSDTHRSTFNEIFGKGRNRFNLDDQLLQKTLETHLGKIYKCFEQDCPELKRRGKGKQEILRIYLTNIYLKERERVKMIDQFYNSVNEMKNPQEFISLEFIGRDNDLTELVRLSKQYRLVLIKAGGGFGKSTLAKRFLDANFRTVIELDMGLSSGEVTPASDKVASILRKLGEETTSDFQTDLTNLRAKLSDGASPIAVLMDNLEPILDEDFRFRNDLRGYEDLLKVLSDHRVSSFTLITSRRSPIIERVQYYEYLLKGLDITAWQQYFHDCENVETSEALSQMCEAYNGNAEVMNLLHGAIKDKNRFDGNIEAYWNRYKDALLGDPRLESLISTEMNWLQDYQPNAYKLLCRMGCYRYQYPVKNIPFESLTCQLWDLVETKRINTIEYLSKGSLIEQSKGKYYLHPAVREAALSRLSENFEDKRIANCQAAEFWTKSIDIAEDAEDALIALEAYHHYIACEQFEQASEILVKSRISKWNIGRDEILTMSFSRLGLVQEMITAITSLLRKVEHTYSYQLAILYSELAYFYYNSGHHHKSIEFQKKGRDVVNHLLDSIPNLDKNQEFRTRLIELEQGSMLEESFCHIDLGDISEAVNLISEAVAISDILGILKSRKIIDIVVNIAYSDDSIVGLKGGTYYFLIRNLVHKEVLNLNLSPQASVHGLIFLALAYKNLGKMENSLDVYKAAIAFADKVKYRLLRARALNGIAELHRKQNNLDKALSNHLEVIDLLEKIGAKFDKAEAYFQLGLTYQAMGEHDQAKEYKTKAIEFFAQMEAPKQIQRVNKAFEGNIQ